MGKWEEYDEAAEKQEERIKDRLFNNEIDEEKHAQSLDYIYEMVKADIMDEYLVDGAVLMCEKATRQTMHIEGLSYWVKNGGESRLRVNHSRKVKYRPYAGITDSIKNENIFSFGNCTIELTSEDKARLKADFHAKIFGTCHCLMRPSKKWDIYPQCGPRTFSENGVPGLTMGAGLFCERGAWILPVTSGQEERQYGYEDTIGALTEEEIEFAYEFGLEENQLVIFEEMREYFKNYPELKTGNTIFAFEGLGSYSGTTNSHHPYGQFGAIFISCRNMELLYATDNCSTLPDYNKHATIEDGVYQAVHVLHNGQYQAIQLWTSGNNQGISSCYHTGENNEATYRLAYGINMHTAKNIVEKTDNPWSKGCLTIADEDYYQFASTAGFVAVVENGIEIDTYEEIKANLYYDFQKKNSSWGYVVVNREYMDPLERERFLSNYEERMER